MHNLQKKMREHKVISSISAENMEKISKIEIKYKESKNLKKELLARFNQHNLKKTEKSNSPKKGSSPNKAVLDQESQ